MKSFFIRSFSSGAKIFFEIYVERFGFAHHTRFVDEYTHQHERFFDVLFCLGGKITYCTACNIRRITATARAFDIVINHTFAVDPRLSNSSISISLPVMVGDRR